MSRRRGKPNKPATNGEAAPAPQHAQPPLSIKASVWIPLALVAGVFAIYCRMFGYGFISYDTNYFVIGNPFINRGLTAEGLRWALGGIHGGYYMPLTILTHMLDCQLYGFHPAGHFLTNILIHALNCVLLWVVLQRLTGSVWRSACVAALFAFHPLRVEAVAWVVERKELLAGTFTLATLLAYHFYARKPAASRYLLVLAALLIALLCKPSAVTLPFAMLLLDFWPLKRLKPSAVTEKIPTLLLAAIFSYMTLHTQQEENIIAEYPLEFRLLTVPLHYIFYLAKFFYPVSLSIFYPIVMKYPEAWQVLLSLLLLGGVSLFATLQARRRPYLAVGWFWFLGVLVPMIGIVQNYAHATADRFMYLPAIGLTLAVVWGAADLLERLDLGNGARGALAGAAILPLMLLSFHQVSFWRDDMTLWTHAINTPPVNCVTYANLALAYEKAGNLPEARKNMELAIEDRPKNSGYHVDLARILNAMGQPDAAMQECQLSLTLKPDNYEKYLGIGEILENTSHFDEAIAQLEKARGINAHDPRVYSGLGFAYAGKQDWTRAAEAYGEALRIYPLFFTANYNMGCIAVRQGDPAKALPYFEAAVHAKPGEPHVLLEIGKIQAARGDRARAAAAFQGALNQARAAGNQALAAEIMKQMNGQNGK